MTNVDKDAPKYPSNHFLFQSFYQYWNLGIFALFWNEYAHTSIKIWIIMSLFNAFITVYQIFFCHCFILNEFTNKANVKLPIFGFQKYYPQIVDNCIKKWMIHQRYWGDISIHFEIPPHSSLREYFAFFSDGVGISCEVSNIRYFMQQHI